MNSKNIKKHLKRKIEDWIASIESESVRKAVRNSVIVTGGAIVSLLTGEEPHDYDLYFRDVESLTAVSDYYVKQWNKSHPDKCQAFLRTDESGRVKVYIKSEGIAGEEEDSEQECKEEPPETERDEQEEKPKHRPVFLTSNAITLSGKIQIVTRFYGEIGEIHKNYDFVHCTCAWSMWDNQLFLPQKALECIINKELFYVGSRYPLCSIIRTRKYLERGYHINAGQYVKMAMQLNELDLKDVNVLEDQLTGVDTGYFEIMISAVRKHQEDTGDTQVDNTYVIELINRLF